MRASWQDREPDAGESFAQTRSPPKAGGESISRTSTRTHKPSVLLVRLREGWVQIAIQHASTCSAQRGDVMAGGACAHSLSRECTGPDLRGFGLCDGGEPESVGNFDFSDVDVDAVGLGAAR